MKLTVENVKQFCDEYFDYDIGIKCRVQTIAENRFYYYYFCKSFLIGVTTTVIGENCGYKDHSSVVHGLKRFDILYQVDDIFKERYNAFEHEALKRFKIDFTNAPDSVSEQLKKIYRLEIKIQNLNLELSKEKRNSKAEIRKILKEQEQMFV